MNIEVRRRWLTDQSTISEVLVDGKHFGFGLEDVDRGLKSTMEPGDTAKRKVWGQTAIPTGRYRLGLTFSPRFQARLPIVFEVKGFTGIRIHVGNRAVNTDGCLLLGLVRKPNEVQRSRDAMNRFIPLLEAGLAAGPVWVEYTYAESVVDSRSVKYPTTTIPRTTPVST